MRFSIFLILILMVQPVFAQRKKNKVAKKESASVSMIQPTIMVIPFVKEGESLRHVYEADDRLNLRIAVTKVKEAFDKKNIPTIDFRGKVKQLSMDKHMEATNQISIKQQVIEISGADIYVEVESAITKDDSGNGATVTATAYNAFSGEVLASDVATTSQFYTDNFEKLSQQAVDEFSEAFIVNVQQKFQEIIKNGRSVVVNIGFDENATVDMDTEMEDGRLFSDVLEEWFEKNAHQSYFHIQGVTATKMILDEVRIPVRDLDSGRHYRVTTFAGKLRNFLKSQSLEVSRDIVGSKIYITIK